MSQIENVVTEGFLVTEEQNIIKVLDHIENNPMSNKQKVEALMREIRRTLNFGIEKGIFIDQCTKKRITAAENKKFKNYINELVYSINEEIDDEIQKNKYKK